MTQLLMSSPATNDIPVTDDTPVTDDIISQCYKLLPPNKITCSYNWVNEMKLKKCVTNDFTDFFNKPL